MSTNKKMDAADRTVKTALTKHELNNIDISKVFKDPINLKIQEQFDFVFKAKKSKSASSDDEYSLDNLFGETTTETPSNVAKEIQEEMPSPTLVFNADDLSTPDLAATSEDDVLQKEDANDLNLNTNDDEGGIGLNLGSDTDEEMNLDSFEDTPEAPAAESNEGGIDFSMDGAEEFEFDDSTKSSHSRSEKVSLEEASLEEDSESIDFGALEEKEDVEEGGELNFGDSTASNEMISTEDSRKNIESTISNIIKPVKEKTMEFNANIKDPESTNEKILIAAVQAEREDGDGDELNFDDTPPALPNKKSAQDFSKTADSIDHISPNYQAMSSEDSIRYQSTIRQLREEREDLLLQMKDFKNQVREAEQDNLTLKAHYEEIKIELSILRKKQNIELEDLKYKLNISEEKRLLIEEKYRQAEKQKEKLEQKVRIDYNQVKMREKELESKLELMSMDIDSQLKSRDSKILELRRKIDSLEFNMENAAIKEQKSQDDKRKVEDKLNKIMKTLRNSIESLEESVDESIPEKDMDK